jgi:hypothetical protein
MKKKLAVLICLGLSAVTGLNAKRSRCDINSPVCRFIDFYIAAEQSEMTVAERVLYGLAVAVRTPDTRCSAPAPAIPQQQI